MGIFIQVQIDEKRLTPEVAEMILSLCPVDVFALDGEQLIVQPDQEDECTLCELCLDAAPVGTLTIRKTYKDEQLLSRGAALNPIDKR
jgi:NAD-dependent dihydropyrimidine dehydrogenase PreA subunit